MSINTQRLFLKQAKQNKNDEFYTQLKDIESELQHYKNNFNNKIVFCNCDDPIISNFYKYFALNFKELGLKKLISACYVRQENDRNLKKGYYYQYTGREEEKIFPDYNDVSFFDGDGDFRSEESMKLLEEADIIVTNPPFSLFREYIAQIIKYNKKFLTIGNVNSITYKEIFKLIKENKAWLGINLGRGVSGFIVPEHYELYGTETKIDNQGNKIISPNNCLWLTNLDIEKRYKDLSLTKQYKGNEYFYPTYDNYDGINVNKTKEIPFDYRGIIGVPITFLHKFNPNQFEIIKFRKGDDDKDLSINGKCPYFRILIKNKKIRVDSI